MSTDPVYFDYNATTPVDERVLQAMLPYFSQQFGNAASRSHGFGMAASRAVEQARRQVASLLGAQPEEIVWTSGATESINLALLGLVRARLPRPSHVITQATEHSAVLDTCRELERLGAQVTYLPVDCTGRVSVDQVWDALRDDTVLVSIMAANNEIGAIQPIREIGAVCQRAGVLFHTDATQAVGKLPIDVRHDGIDLLSLSAHKLYGPKGVGALYVREVPTRVALHPILFGGGHERGYRSGTINVPGVIGLGKACAVAGEEMAAEGYRLASLRDYFERELQTKFTGVEFHGRSPHRLPHVTNVSFPGVTANVLLAALHDVAASAGSACTSAKKEPSHVLNALGIAEESIYGAVRFSLGRFSTRKQVDYVVQRLRQVVGGAESAVEPSVAHSS